MAEIPQPRRHATGHGGVRPSDGSRRPAEPAPRHEPTVKQGDLFKTEKGEGRVLVVTKPTPRLPAEALVYFEHNDEALWFDEKGKEMPR